MRAAVLGLVLSLSTPAAVAGADDAPAPGPRGRIAFDREEHDFGVARQEQDLRAEFTVKNAGEGTLRLVAVRADCGCAVPAVDVRELAPGASTPLRVVFRTMAFAGPMTKRVRVWSDDPERPTVDLRLRIDVSAGVVLMPPRLVFGDVLRGTTPEAALTARWKEGVGAPFRVVRTDPGPLDLEVRAEPFEAPPWKGTRLVARFRTPPPMGPVAGTLLVETDAPGQARLHVPVAAHVSGRVWTSLRAVRLGIVPKGLERRVPVVVRGFTPDVDLGEVTAAARGGRVTATAMRLAGSPKEWTVMVGVDAGAAPGKLDDVVEIRTAVESEPVTEIPVSGEVVARAR